MSDLLKLPNYESAIVPKAKIVDYLLSLTHPAGKDKAQFFIAYGFSADKWEKLADALKEHASHYKVTKIDPSALGTHYVIEGNLNAADGRTPFVRVVWFIDEGKDVPRLATAYPRKPKRLEEEA